MKKQMLFKTKGMNQDLSVSAFNPEFSFENMNLRLSTNEGNTQLSWVNEKGTLGLPVVKENDSGTATEIEVIITGIPIGTAIINHYLILFIKDSTYDYIYRLKYTDNTKTTLQCFTVCQSISAYLDWDVEHPLETLVSYESDSVQKVYWVDGKNQPRVVNICKSYGEFNSGAYCVFDFVRELQLNEIVTVQKQLGATGMFAPGVIQYAFTYYDKYGQETNIFYTTPLYYISNADRGASPEDKVENAFVIKVNDVDRHFDYLRIYSIQRTSINGTPICKRIQDIDIQNITAVNGHYNVSYTDTGTSGDSVDPTELLYKGGEEVAASTIEQKDNTLFLGNLKYITQMKETDIDSILSSNWSITDTTRYFTANGVSYGNYAYANQLTSNSGNETVPCGYFKGGDYYRVGVQFQYKTGKWSKPVFLKDHQVGSSVSSTNYPRPSISGNTITVPIIQGSISAYAAGRLIQAGYKKVRPVVVFPNMQDRLTICQGVVNPTLYTYNQRHFDKNLYSQASWFFRPQVSGNIHIRDNTVVGTVSPTDYADNAHLMHALNYTQRHIKENVPDSGSVFNPQYMRQVEIQGDFEDANKFCIDTSCLTFHSPDVEFDSRLSVMNFNNLGGWQVGNAEFTNTLSDIDIQTETPTVSNSGSGFVHKSFADSGSYGIVSGLFYEDYIIDDWDSKIGKDESEQSPYKWFVYAWNKKGSLNNDFLRPADRGVQTAMLKKKVISNLRYATSSLNSEVGTSTNFTENPQLFSSDEVSILKLANDVIYQGNINTSLIPDHADGMYFAFNNNDYTAKNIQTPFSSNEWWKTFSIDEEQSNQEGIRKWNDSNEWEWKESHFGDYFVDLVLRKEPVRMTYKSTPHIVFRSGSFTWNNNCLPIVEIRRTNLSTNTIFGGQTKDAFRENTWVPCGKPVPLNSSTGSIFYYSYGDTYYQRWDCLKTYAFTKEDVNQIVEIGSFMLETKVNIDGRYDRNRGQMNNLNMSPVNFNLLNPVYSQIDNFFSYKIMDDESYANQNYPNQLTWSKTKDSAADIDLWTNITMASVLELDGNKGEITALQRFNDQLICFQDSGISQILYNENTQISTTEGVPIEIANSGKVQGKRYLSDTIGCSNKWSIVNTPIGIYFMDSNDKSIYLFNGQLNNVSASGGFNAWCKNNIPASSIAWTPTDFNTFKACYDRLNQDVLFINKTKALAFSEKLGAFTSFYDYGNTPFFENLDDTGLWIAADLVNGGYKLWKHQAGSYGKFFGVSRPYWMTLIGNPEPQLDKIFTNLEFRACTDMDNPGDINLKPFDYIESWDEYQHGYAHLDIRNGHTVFKHHTSDGNAHLAKKFRIWRCDIPRDNYEFLSYPEQEEGETAEHYQNRVNEYKEWLQSEHDKGIFRTAKHPMDRMRNPWLYLKLYHGEAGYRDSLRRTEIHDVVMTYFT